MTGQLTASQLGVQFAAAVATELRIRTSPQTLEDDLAQVVAAVPQVPDMRRDAVPGIHWDNTAHRQRLWRVRGVVATRGDVYSALRGMLREVGASPRAYRVLLGPNRQWSLDHELTLRFAKKPPTRRGIVGAPYFNQRTGDLWHRPDIRSWVDLADQHGLVVVLGSFSAYYPGRTIRVEVLGRGLAEELYPEEASPRQHASE